MSELLLGISWDKSESTDNSLLHIRCRRSGFGGRELQVAHSARNARYGRAMRVGMRLGIRAAFRVGQRGFGADASSQPRPRPPEAPRPGARPQRGGTMGVRALWTLGDDSLVAMLRTSRSRAIILKGCSSSMLNSI